MPGVDQAGSHLTSISKGEFQLREIASGERVQTEQLNDGRAVTLGPNQWLAYTDYDFVYWDEYQELRTAYVSETGRLIFNGHASVLAALSPQGDSLYFFNVRSGEVIHVQESGRRPYLAAAFSPNGCLLVGIPEYGSLSFWQMFPYGTAGLVETGTTRETQIIDAALALDGRLLVLGTLDGGLQVWGLEGVLEAPPRGEEHAQGRRCTLSLPSPTPTLSATQTQPPPPIPSTPTPVPFTRNLFLTDPNMEGPDVMALQTRLLALGYSEIGVPEGVFGPLTDQAVRQYQEDNGLVVDGIVGPVTWEKLFGAQE